MTDQTKCPACETERYRNMENDDFIHQRTCTGRPGCVRTAPVPPGPATSEMDIVERLQALVSLDRPENGGPYGGSAARECMRTMTEAADALVAKDAEIARLRAEAERLTAERDDARRLLEEAKTLIGTLQWSLEWEKEGRRKDRAQAEADRAALAQRVAEAVREACAVVAGDLWCDADAVRALDLGPIVAAVLKKEGE